MLGYQQFPQAPAWSTSSASPWTSSRQTSFNIGREFDSLKVTIEISPSCACQWFWLGCAPPCHISWVWSPILHIPRHICPKHDAKATFRDMAGESTVASSSEVPSSVETSSALGGSTCLQQRHCVYAGKVEAKRTWNIPGTCDMIYILLHGIFLVLVILSKEV